MTCALAAFSPHNPTACFPKSSMMPSPLINIAETRRDLLQAIPRSQWDVCQPYRLPGAYGDFSSMEAASSAPSPYEPSLLDVSSLRIERPIVQIQNHIKKALTDWDQAELQESSSSTSLQQPVSQMLEKRFVDSTPKRQDLEDKIRQLGESSAHFLECVSNTTAVLGRLAQSTAKGKDNKISQMANASGLHIPNAVQSIESTFDSAYQINKGTSTLGAAKLCSLSKTKKALYVAADPSMLPDSEGALSNPVMKTDSSSTEILVELRIFRSHCTGMERPEIGKKKESRDKVRLSQTILFRPGMTLETVRDQIYCLCDMFPANKGNSFFFIEGVFYSDDKRVVRQGGSTSHSDSTNETLKWEEKIPVIADIRKWQEKVLQRSAPTKGPSERDKSCNGESRRGSVGGSSEAGASFVYVEDESGADSKNGVDLSNSVPPRATKRRCVTSRKLMAADHLNIQGFDKKPSRIVPMDSVCLNDLSVRLGAPYVYCHSHGCEHLISFTDLRVAHGKIPRTGEEYPRETFRRVLTRRDCDACMQKGLKANYALLDHEFSGKDPLYLCEKCYVSFNYDKDGKLLPILSKSKAYVYFHEL